MSTAPRPSLTAWQRVAAAGIEGLYVLLYLLLRLTDFLPLLLLWESGTTTRLNESGWVALCVMVGSWLLQATLLPPLRLGRDMWYCHLAANPAGIPPLRVLFCGFQRLGDAVSWRWRLWWQRTILLTIGFVPTALIWGYGSLVGGSILWLCAGFLPFGLTLLLTYVWQCRYAATALLLAHGWGAAAAMHLSVRLMRRNKGRYINLWGSYCVQPLRWRLTRAAFLLHLCEITEKDAGAQRKGNPCFLRPSLL